jgi:glutathione S-transferase
MKVYFSPASPFVRKVLACAIELGVGDQIQRLPSNAGPVNRDRTITADNPLGQVPTFFADDGTVLYDSRVICEYLDTQAGGHRLFPAPGPDRWRALVEQSLGDGMLDAALLARYESVLRPDELLWPAWMEGQMDKVAVALDQIEGKTASFGDRADIGTITIACALGYLDFRFPDYGWSSQHPALGAWYETFARRPSMAQTAPSS